MLKKSASGVLVSLRGAERTEGYFRVRQDRIATGERLHKVRSVPPGVSSLAAALQNRGHFEHPEPVLTSAPYGRFQRHFVYNSSFSAAC